jgi:hypothetical protein
MEKENEARQNHATPFMIPIGRRHLVSGGAKVSARRPEKVDHCLKSIVSGEETWSAIILSLGMSDWAPGRRVDMGEVGSGDSNTMRRRMIHLLNSTLHHGYSWG